jgi:hypothetical protein
MRRRQRLGVVGLVILVVAGATACSSEHGPPRLTVARSVAGTRVAYGGIALTVPTSWRTVNGAPPFCGSRLARVVYAFNTEHSAAVPGGSCGSYPVVGPYVSVECEPFNPQPQGRVVKLGGLKATEFGQSTTHGLTDVTFYLKRQDAVLDIYASPTEIRSIGSSVAGHPGTC